ncbi:MAG: YkvA family protein [Acidimicrobiia bacterium]
MEETSRGMEIVAIDDATPVEARSRQELVIEAAMLLPNVVKLLSRMLRDRRVPMRRKVLIGAVLAYVISPVDLIPDFVVGIGRLDDLVLVSLAIDHLMSGVDEDIVRMYWDGTEDGLDLIRSVFAWGAAIIPDGIRRLLPR